MDSLRLLCDFPSVLVPEVVWAEARRYRPHLFDLPNPSFSRIRPRHPPHPALAALSRLMPLHAGETQALQIGEEYGADLLLTDDTAARLAAREFLLPVHGTLGILLRAIRRGQRSSQEVLDLLRAIPRTVDTPHQAVAFARSYWGGRTHCRMTSHRARKRGQTTKSLTSCQ